MHSLLLCLHVLFKFICLFTHVACVCGCFKAVCVCVCVSFLLVRLFHVAHNEIRSTPCSLLSGPFI